MQQRLDLGRAGKVAGFPPEVEVRQPHRLGHRGLSEFPIVVRQQQKPARRSDQQDQHRHGGNQPPSATCPELPVRKPTGLNIAINNPGNQVPGDDKEDIDTNIAARQSQAGVINQHRQHGHGPQSIHVGTVAESGSMGHVQ